MTAISALVAETLGLKTSPEKMAALWAVVNSGALDGVTCSDLRNLLSDISALSKGAIRDAQRIRWLESGHGDVEPPTDLGDLALRMRAHVNRRLGAPASGTETTGYLANGAWAMLIHGANAIDALRTLHPTA